MGIVKDLLYKVSSKTQFKTRFKKEAMFPYYHIVADEKQPHIKYLYAYKNIQQFISDVNLLKSKYKPLLPDNIIKNRKGGFLLTFDDGLREIYTTIYPILKRKGLTAIFFINPDFVDNNKMMHKHRLSVLFHHIEKLDCDKNILKKSSQNM